MFALTTFKLMEYLSICKDLPPVDFLVTSSEAVLWCSVGECPVSPLKGMVRTWSSLWRIQLSYPTSWPCVSPSRLGKREVQQVNEYHSAFRMNVKTVQFLGKGHQFIGSHLSTQLEHADISVVPFLSTFLSIFRTISWTNQK